MTRSTHPLRLLGQAVLSVALVFLPHPCFAKSPKIAPDLRDVNPHTNVDVIVQFKAPPDGEQDAGVTRLGGVRRAELKLIHGALYSIPAAALDGLANNPNVVYVSPDRKVDATLDYANPAVGAEIALSYGWDGTGVGIA